MKPMPPKPKRPDRHRPRVTSVLQTELWTKKFNPHPGDAWKNTAFHAFRELKPVLAFDEHGHPLQWEETLKTAAQDPAFIRRISEQTGTPESQVKNNLGKEIMLEHLRLHGEIPSTAVISRQPGSDRHILNQHTKQLRKHGLALQRITRRMELEERLLAGHLPPTLKTLAPLMGVGKKYLSRIHGRLKREGRIPTPAIHIKEILNHFRQNPLQLLELQSNETQLKKRLAHELEIPPETLTTQISTLRRRKLLPPGVPRIDELLLFLTSDRTATNAELYRQFPQDSTHGVRGLKNHLIRRGILPADSRQPLPLATQKRILRIKAKQQANQRMLRETIRQRIPELRKEIEAPQEPLWQAFRKIPYPQKKSKPMQEPWPTKPLVFSARKPPKHSSENPTKNFPWKKETWNYSVSFCTWPPNSKPDCSPGSAETPSPQSGNSFPPPDNWALTGKTCSGKFHTTMH
ncbi:MAG: hypothetical protein HY917_02010 [Candidatus Diapherotrites archaeon]|nr:hypothetical protein [Candidatus Diapherotrites archaeon]